MSIETALIGTGIVLALTLAMPVLAFYWIEHKKSH